MTLTLNGRTIILILLIIACLLWLARSCGHSSTPQYVENTAKLDSVSRANAQLKKRLTDTATYFAVQLSNASQRASKSGDSVKLYSSRVDNLKETIGGLVMDYMDLRDNKKDSLALVKCDSIARQLKDSVRLVTFFQNKVVENQNDLFSVSRIKDSIANSWHNGFDSLFRAGLYKDSVTKQIVNSIKPRNQLYIGGLVEGNAATPLWGYGAILALKTKNDQIFQIAGIQNKAVIYYQASYLIKISFHKK